jgi:NADP-dependent 3-hydroxy acid dehydrogenase YdfG
MRVGYAVVLAGRRKEILEKLADEGKATHRRGIGRLDVRYGF